jgi:glycosyl transferase family 25
LTTAHCYAVNQRVMSRLIDFLTVVKGRERGHPQGGRMHYDGALNVFCATYPDVVRLRSSRNLMEQRSSRSDIAEKSWIDRTPLAFGIVEQGRRVKNELRRRRRAEASGPAPSSGPPRTP